MAYQVKCECGKSHEVTAGDAGSSLQCNCGRAVEVPALHELRHEAGEDSLSPVVRLQSLLLAGQLPGTSRCCRCGKETEGMARVMIQCEWALVKSGTTQYDRLAGCLLLGWIGLVFADFIFRRPPTEHGQDEVITVPIRVCEACEPELRTADSLRAALRKTPDYADLLDRYPRARITRAN